MASRCLAAPMRLAARLQAAPTATSLASQRWSSSSSTSALAYKAIRRRSSPLPVDQTPAWSAQAAVSNILYETPTPSMAPPKRHILNCLVQNEPGVLSRVSGILAARGFNIDSLVVCSTEVEDLSRMTIVLTGQDGVVEQARRQLEDLVPVWAVLDYTNAALVQRELVLAKINILGPDPKVSGTILVLAALPEEMNFGINVTNLRATADVLYKGDKMGVLNLDRWNHANSTRVKDEDEHDPLLKIQSRVEEVPLNITDGDVFSDVMAKLFFGGEDVMLDVYAKVDVQIKTALGKVILRDVPAEGSVPVKRPYSF
ncbi:hypothetical protein BN1723_015734 [Verticillium longisporum]|uniref:ACT domain-containing protein n=1 Tax=Verticillium longisporum TaxID=100787 RepID=A0A0G4N297_VERLO|nr:hypothetical protein BN1723_015734 [Verticillium longisporum]